MAAHPDPGYRLTAEERKLLRPGFDASALERLLAHYPADTRGEILRLFAKTAPGTPVTFLDRVEDPRLQALLEEVYAQHWRNIPRETLDHGRAVIALREVPITIALVPGANADAPATVVRRPGAGARSIIFLQQEGTDARHLAAAMRMLARDENDSPGIPASERRLILRQLPPALPAGQAAPLGRAEQLIQEVRRAPLRHVEGYGELRAIDLTRVPRREPGALESWRRPPRG